MSKKKSIADQEKVMAQLAELPTMAVRHLQARYLELFGEPTRSRNRDYLVKKLSWRLQEIAEGGVDGIDLSCRPMASGTVQPGADRFGGRAGAGGRLRCCSRRIQERPCLSYRD